MATRCSFCFCADKVNHLSAGPACWQCRGATKKTKKGTPLFFDVACSEYVTAPPVDDGARRTALIDLHNVADLFEVDVMAALASELVEAGVRIIFLSFVGATSKTRLSATAQLKAIVEAASPNSVEAYLCFQRGDAPHPANKGGFAAALKCSDLTFLDDSADHVAAVAATGATTVLVPTDRAKSDVQQLITATLKGLKVPSL